MKRYRKTAYEILDISQKIYQMQEATNPTAIFGKKEFIIGSEETREEIFVKPSHKKDRFYYFEHPKIEGVIIKKENGSYCIKGMVKYTNSSNQDLWFAKIRIEHNEEDIQLKGSWGGSWQTPDFYDKNLIEDSNPDFPIAIVSMKEHLVDIYNNLCKNNGQNSNSYDSKDVKKLKKYNN